uniref:Uncharacterized protein n=1 Tax=Aureoumbra lagunensis TaxID=44058 RepID=A0A7S3NM98_9STRA|mmetsp:Transcript_22113/g.27476  ORF Transcript_22113/g.27476 Transcript_22113/m.27476 type:complete len:226 (+) Transcript_22113:44-721(+)
MFRLASVVLALAIGVHGLVPLQSGFNTNRKGIVVHESFGLNFAEDQAANTPIEILGERRLKTEFIKSYKPTATLLEGKPYPLLQEIQNKRLLSATCKADLLTTLEDLGLSLSDIEKILPAIEKAGLLSSASKNLPLAIILTGYLLVEPAPFLIPILGNLLKVPSFIWGVTALSAASLEALIVLSDSTEYSSAGFILVPVALLSAILGGIPVAIDAVSRLPPPSAK